MSRGKELGVIDELLPSGQWMKEFICICLSEQGIPPAVIRHRAWGALQRPLLSSFTLLGLNLGRGGECGCLDQRRESERGCRWRPLGCLKEVMDFVGLHLEEWTQESQTSTRGARRSATWRVSWCFTSEWDGGNSRTKHSNSSWIQASSPHGNHSAAKQQTEWSQMRTTNTAPSLGRVCVCLGGGLFHLMSGGMQWHGLLFSSSELSEHWG